MPVGFVHVDFTLYPCISPAPTGQISMKFDVEEFYENLSRIPKFG